MTVMLVWLMLIASGDNTPVIVLFTTQALCEEQLADTILEGKKQDMVIEGACREVRLAQIKDQEV